MERDDVGGATGGAQFAAEGVVVEDGGGADGSGVFGFEEGLGVE